MKKFFSYCVFSTRITLLGFLVGVALFAPVHVHGMEELGKEENFHGRVEAMQTQPYSTQNWLSSSYYTERVGAAAGTGLAYSFKGLSYILAADKWFKKEDQVNPSLQGMAHALMLSAGKEVVEECAGQIILHGLRGSFQVGKGGLKLVMENKGAAMKFAAGSTGLLTLLTPYVYQQYQFTKSRRENRQQHRATCNKIVENRKEIKRVGEHVNARAKEAQVDRDSKHADAMTAVDNVKQGVDKNAEKLDNAELDRETKHKETLQKFVFLGRDIAEANRVLGMLKKIGEKNSTDVEGIADDLRKAKEALQNHIDAFDEKVKAIVIEANDAQTKELVEQMLQDKVEILEKIKGVDDKCLSQEEKDQFTQQITDFGSALKRLANIEGTVSIISSDIAIINDNVESIQQTLEEREKKRLERENTLALNQAEQMRIAKKKSKKEAAERMRIEKEDKVMLNAQVQRLKKEYAQYNKILKEQYGKKKHSEKEEQETIEEKLMFPEDNSFDQSNNSNLKKAVEKTTRILREAKERLHEKMLSETLSYAERIEFKLESLGKGINSILDGSDIKKLSQFRKVLLKEVDEKLDAMDSRLGSLELKLDSTTKKNNVTEEKLLRIIADMKKAAKKRDKQIQDLTNLIVQQDKSNKARQEQFAEQYNRNHAAVLAILTKQQTVDSSRRIEGNPDSVQNNLVANIGSTEPWDFKKSENAEYLNGILNSFASMNSHDCS